MIFCHGAPQPTSTVGRIAEAGPAKYTASAPSLEEEIAAAILEFHGHPLAEQRRQFMRQQVTDARLLRDCLQWMVRRKPLYRPWDTQRNQIPVFQTDELLVCEVSDLCSMPTRDFLFERRGQKR